MYRSLGNSLAQWTRDHSVIQLWVDQGIITPQEALTSTRSHEITKAIGAPDSQPDFFFAPVVNGERLLICSDGLYSMMNPEALRASLIMSGTPKSTVEALVERAIVNGGNDNITVIVIDVVSGGLTGGGEGDSSIVDQSLDNAVKRAAAIGMDTTSVQVPRSNAIDNFEESGIEDDEAALVAGSSIDFDDEHGDTDDTSREGATQVAGFEVSVGVGDENPGNINEDTRVAPAHETSASFFTGSETAMPQYNPYYDPEENEDEMDDETFVVDKYAHYDDDEETFIVNDDTIVAQDADQDIPDGEDETIVVTRDTEPIRIANLEKVDSSLYETPVHQVEEDEDTFSVAPQVSSAEEFDFIAPEIEDDNFFELDDDDDESYDIEEVNPLDVDPHANAPRGFIYKMSDSQTNTGF